MLKFYKLLMPLTFFFFSLAWAQSTVPEEIGGSDFVTIDLQVQRLSESNAWKNSSIFKTPSCQYSTLKTDIEHQLKEMASFGQKKIGLSLWFTSLSTEQDCEGFLLNSVGGHFSKNVKENISLLIEDINKLGFNEIQVRFFPMGKNSPQEWSAWNEELFDENWSVIESTIASLSENKNHLKILYDLSGELGGIKCNNGICEQYVRKIWHNYTSEFPLESSYGFSIAMAPGRLENMLANLKQSGPLPKQIAFDVYEEKYLGLLTMANEMRPFGVKLPIMFQEVPYGDYNLFALIVKQAHLSNLEVRTIMQWPLGPGDKSKIGMSQTTNYIYRQ